MKSTRRVVREYGEKESEYGGGGAGGRGWVWGGGGGGWGGGGGGGCFFFFQAEDGIRDYPCDWSSDVCSSDLGVGPGAGRLDVAVAGPLAVAIPPRPHRV